MNAAHIHLILTHMPIGGLVLVTILGGVAAISRSDILMRAALAGFTFVALSAIPLYLSGEEAEEQIENTPGVSESDIEKHEHAAFPAFISIELVGALALLALVLRSSGRTSAQLLPLLVLIVALISCVLVGRSANYGGQIRHPEINDAPQSEEP